MSTRTSHGTDRSRRRHGEGTADPADLLLRLPPGQAGYDRYERIRALGPVARSRRGLVLTTSHRLCDHVLRSDQFGATPTMVSPADLDAYLPPDAVVVHPIDDSFLSMDPPRHTELRRLVGPWFTRRALRRWLPHVESVVEQHLEALPTDRPVDLVAGYAEPVPIATITRILGIPRDDHAFTRWATALGAVLDGARRPEELQRLAALLQDLAEFFGDLLDRRRAEPRDDLVSDLVRHEARHRLSGRDVLATVEMLLLGGFETTANLIGTGILAVATHPDQRAALAEDNFVDELLRHEPPVQYTVRVATRDTTLAGETLTAGTPVVTLLAAANRDPDVFDHPDELRFDRPNARDHLAFGAGTHYCIGAGLARLQATTALRALFDRHPHLRVTGPPTYRPSRMIRGPHHLTAQLRPAPTPRAATQTDRSSSPE